MDESSEITDLDKLMRGDMKGVANSPITEQVTYADSVTKKWCSDAKWCTQQLANISTITSENVKLANVSSIGNMAFCTLHAPTPELRNGYRAVLNNLIQVINEVSSSNETW
jgi:hypothetical protein